MDKTKIIEPLAKGVALATALLYGLGFVVVNSYLSKFGTSDFTLTNPRFVFAGALCAIYLFVWWFFVGSYLIDLNKDVSEKFLTSHTKFGIFVLLSNFMFTDAIYRLAVATIMFSNTTFEGSYFTDPATGLILFPGFIIITVEKFYPWIIGVCYILLKSIAQIVLVVLFLILADTNQQYLFASYFVLYFLFANFHDQITKTAHDSKSITALLYLSIFVLGAVIAFGYSIYGETKPQYGGGHPTTVTILSKDDLPNDLVFQDANKRFKALMIYSTDKWSLLQIPRRNLLLNQDQIKGLVFPEKSSDVNPRANFEERMRKKGINWFASHGNER